MTAPRADGRAPSQLRPLVCERALLQAADGGAKWTAERTCVLAAAYGPRAVPPRREKPDHAVLDVTVTSPACVRGALDRSTACAVTAALQAVLIAGLHPRTGVSVVLQLVHQDGAALAACVNAACAAAVDAGVPLSSLLAAATVAVSADGTLLLDPTAAEEQAALGVATFAFRAAPAGADGAPASACETGTPGAAGGPEEAEDVVLSMTRGKLTAEQYLASLEAARRAAATVAAFARLSLERHLG